MRNPSPLPALLAKDPGSASKALAQGIANARDLEETYAALGRREGQLIPRKAGDVWTQGPPGGTFKDFLDTPDGLKVARGFVDKMESGPFALMAPPPPAQSGGVA